MIRGAVWPHSKGGVVGAVMLGLGRAMGETIAVALVIGSSASDHVAPVRARQLHARGHREPVRRGPGEFRAALIGLGVMLFVITIIVNLIARGIVERSAPAEEGGLMTAAAEPAEHSTCASRGLAAHQEPDHDRPHVGRVRS